MPQAEDQNRIEELKKSLYSRSAPDVRTRRKLRFTPAESTVQTEWERPPEDELAPPTELNTAYKDHSMSFLSKFLIASFIFCIIAVGLGAYLFFNGANLISGDNIDISIRGPVSIPGGAPVSFDITVVNKNNADLQGVDLSVDFPEGTTDPLDSTKERKNFRELLGDIPAGGTAEKTVGAIMFGEENLQKQIGVTATYKVKGSTALFTKTTSYDVLINSSPIFLTVDAFDTVTSGQEFTTKVSLKSNSQDTLKNVILKAAYPFGYTFVSSDIKPLADNMTWKIGDIPPGAERVIKIRGKIQGEDSEKRVFRFTTGAQSASDPKAIGTQYMSAEQSMTIEKPFISMNIAINGDDAPGDHVSQFGQNERVSLNWFNNLPTTVSNMVIKAKLSGTAYDKNTIQPEQGYFDSANDTVVWDQKTVSDLASVGAGDSGTVTFTFSPKDLGTATNPTVNPSVIISADVSGNRTQETGVSEKLSSIVTRTTRVSSNIALTGRIIRSSGPFGNTGPIPPRAEQATTYTVVWTVDNTSSAVGSARVVATLPPYVKWLNSVSPASESVTYDEHSGQVTWDIGNVSTYTLSASRRREAYFQISLQPGINQVGDTPILVDRATFTAIDNFTAAQLQSQQDALTTRFSTDSSYQEGQAVVTK